MFILGLYRDNGKENGSYRDYRVYIGIIAHEDMGTYRAQSRRQNPKQPCQPHPKVLWFLVEKGLRLNGVGP